ncbi:probable beta-1,4-xylosyltransferase GT43A isoform X1 [Musa acuminata AAA Group]|uniref:probable beta-1,4-xylosyltransferase GT43A isoform X1 n=1 Tax=Musa acuminata AAA Group TaxID=214697 RepID=UPI0031DF68CE
MGSFDRPRKRIQLWKKALIHFALCFVMGFFTGFAPASTASIFSGRIGSSDRPTKPVPALERLADPGIANRSIMAEIPVGESPEPHLDRQLIIITTTRSDDRLQEAFLRRLACTLKLVPPPLLWIVVQARAAAPVTAEMLRKTGVMYRHLTFEKNFTDPAAEADHQRNVALNHVEYHRLAGVVHFADASNVYDLEFFEEIRQIKVFGTWPLATASANRRRVVVDRPVCSSSKVVGWLFKDSSNDKATVRSPMTDADMKGKPLQIDISAFAFNSTILWDPERWGRPTSVPDTSQDSMKFVQKVIREDDIKLKGIPADCSKIMLWHPYRPRVIPLPFQNPR